MESNNISKISIKNKLLFSFFQKSSASLTLEAAVVIPFFALFFIAIISFLIIINVQIGVQVGMEETSRSMGKIAYAIDRSADILSGGNNTNPSKETLDEKSKSLMDPGINSLTTKIWLMANSNLSKVVNNSRIVGGLYTDKTEFDKENGILDMIVEYDYSVPWLPRFWGRIRLVHRVCSHVWIGEHLDKKAGGTDEEDQETVYITPNGTVYHTSASCNYLDLSTHSVAYSSVNSSRNKSGGKYECCSECAKGIKSGNVYITDYGSNYHASLGCSGLKRTVISVNISEVGSRRMCSKCKGN